MISTNSNHNKATNQEWDYRYRVHVRVEQVCCSSILSLVQFYLPLFFFMLIYDNEYETKENKN